MYVISAVIARWLKKEIISKYLFISRERKRNTWDMFTFTDGLSSDYSYVSNKNNNNHKPPPPPPPPHNTNRATASANYSYVQSVAAPKHSLWRRRDRLRKGGDTTIPTRLFSQLPVLRARRSLSVKAGSVGRDPPLNVFIPQKLWFREASVSCWRFLWPCGDRGLMVG